MVLACLVHCISESALATTRDEKVNSLLLLIHWSGLHHKLVLPSRIQGRQFIYSQSYLKHQCDLEGVDCKKGERGLS